VDSFCMLTMYFIAHWLHCIMTIILLSRNDLCRVHSIEESNCSKGKTVTVMRLKLRCAGGCKQWALISFLQEWNMWCVTAISILFAVTIMWKNRRLSVITCSVGHVCWSNKYKRDTSSDVTYQITWLCMWNVFVCEFADLVNNMYHNISLFCKIDCSY
jgi:hypothetical protein